MIFSNSDGRPSKIDHRTMNDYLSPINPYGSDFLRTCHAAGRNCWNLIALN